MNSQFLKYELIHKSDATWFSVVGIKVIIFEVKIVSTEINSLGVIDSSLILQIKLLNSIMKPFLLVNVLK